jgi:1,4-dihydroxy-2-naphthoyl-CoA hydrolase
MFTYETEIKWHQTDAAGVLFFAYKFTLIHDAYQALMESIGFSLSRFISEFNFALPIVHTEADYRLPLKTGDKIEIHVSIDQIGNSSFTLAYVLQKQNGDQAGTAQTVHVAIDKDSRNKITLPATLASALDNYGCENR